jgi:hypothetical protein
MPLMRDQIGGLGREAMKDQLPWFDRAPVFELTNVQRSMAKVNAAHVRASGSVDIDMSAFPGITPPYAAYWMEWALPKWLGPRGDFGREAWLSERIGVWMQVIGGKDMAFHKEKGRHARDGDEGWTLAADVWFDYPKLGPLGAWRWIIDIDPDGTAHDPGEPQFFADDVKQRRWIAAHLHGESLERQRGTSRDAGARLDGDLVLGEDDDDPEVAEVVARFNRLQRAKAEGDQVVIDAMEQYVRADIEVLRRTELACEQKAQEYHDKLLDIHARWDQLMARAEVLPTLLYAHSLLACKNVETETVKPPAKLSKARQRRGHPPMVSYRTLMIRPSKGSSAGERISLGDGQSAAHIVRGHVKQYTQDAPLFGKHVGNWFWAPQLRGSEEHGTIIKDYKVA